MGPLCLPQPGDLQSCPQQAQKPTYDVWRARPRWHTRAAVVHSRDSGQLGCAQWERGTCRAALGTTTKRQTEERSYTGHQAQAGSEQAGWRRKQAVPLCLSTMAFLASECAAHVLRGHSSQVTPQSHLCIYCPHASYNTVGDTTTATACLVNPTRSGEVARPRRLWKLP